MKFSKHLILAVCICGIFQTAAFAIDGGALITNNTIFKTDKDQKYFLNQKDNVSAWVRIPFADSSENGFIAEGLYAFEDNQNVKESFNFLDVNLFKASYVKHYTDSMLKVEGGRFFNTALSPIIFAQNSDGLKVSYSNTYLSASIFGSYTGLLNRNIVKMIDAPDYKLVDSKKVYDLADKYFITAATLAFNNLFYNQSIAAQFTGAFRLETVSCNRMYATILMKGPIVKNLIYTFDGTVAFTKYGTEDSKTSFLAKLEAGYYFDTASISADFTLASKDFIAITSSAALDNYTEPEYTGLLKTGLSATYKPIDNLIFSGTFDAAFDVEKDYEFKGIQYSASIGYQIFTDLYAGLIWKQYYDMNDSDIDFSSITIKVKFAF